MAIVLSPEAQAKAERIPNFAQRLERFINDQYALEQWRAQRLKAFRTSALPAIEAGLACREGHWVAVGELPADFDLERFIEEQREARIRQIAGL
jgi:hypothetical protein